MSYFGCFEQGFTGNAARPGAIAADLVFLEDSYLSSKFDGKVCRGQPRRATADDEQIVSFMVCVHEGIDETQLLVLRPHLV